MFQCFPIRKNVSDQPTSDVNGNYFPPQSPIAGAATERDHHLETTELVDSHEIKLAIYHLIAMPRVYHTGVLVHGKEYHYGIRTGVLVCDPMNNDLPLEPRIMLHMRLKFKFFKYMTLRNHRPRTALTRAQVVECCADLERDAFSKRTFHLICRNCIDFSRAFVNGIAAGGPPPLSAWPEEFRQPRFLTFVLRPVLRGLGAGRPPASVSHRRSTSSSAPSTEEGTTKRENDENEENPKNLDLQREIKGEMEENPMKMGDNEEAMGKLLDQYYRLSLAAESKPKRNNKIDGKAKRAVVASPS